MASSTIVRRDLPAVKFARESMNRLRVFKLNRDETTKFVGCTCHILHPTLTNLCLLKRQHRTTEPHCDYLSVVGLNVEFFRLMDRTAVSIDHRSPSCSCSDIIR